MNDLVTLVLSDLSHRSNDVHLEENTVSFDEISAVSSVLCVVLGEPTQGRPLNGCVQDERLTSDMQGIN